MDDIEKGKLYEIILENHAKTLSTDSAEFPTPLPLAKTIIRVMNITPDKTIHDCACGTGRFFITCHDYILNNFKLDNPQKRLIETVQTYVWIYTFDY